MLIKQYLPLGIFSIQFKKDKIFAFIDSVSYLKSVAGGIYESAFIDSRGKFRVNFTELQKAVFSNLHLKIGHLLHFIFNKKKFYKKIGQFIEAELGEYLPKFMSLATNQGLYELIKAKIRRQQIPADTNYLCGFVSIHDGLYYRVASNDFLTDEEFHKGILASTAMPIVWQPIPEIQVIQNGKPILINYAMDGGLRNNSLLGDIIEFINQDKESDYHILVVNCSSGKVDISERKWNIASIALRSLTEITMAEIFNNDIEEFLRINDLVIQAESKGIALTKKDDSGKEIVLRKFNCTIINPDDGILGDTLSCEPGLMQTRIAHGEQKAEMMLKSIH